MVFESWIVGPDNIANTLVQTIRTGVERYEVWVVHDGQENSRLAYSTRDDALQGHRAAAYSLAVLTPDSTVQEVRHS